MALRLVSILVASIVLQACSTGAMFVTKTSMSIMDVDSTPPGASIAYDRVEGFIGPLNDDGTLPSVVARIESDGRVLNPRIQQVYATGDAALAITGAQVGMPPAVLRKSRGLAFFGTSTSTGVKVDFSDTFLPRGFVFGYRRKELSTIPALYKDATSGHYVYPPLLAMIDTAVEITPGSATPVDIDKSKVSTAVEPDNGGDGKANGDKKRGTVRLGVCQSFATGDAATKLASDARKRESSLSCGATSAEDLFENYDDSVAFQLQSSASLLSCYSGVKEGDRRRIWEETARLGLFSSADATEELAEDQNEKALASIFALETAIDQTASAQVIADKKREVDGLYATLLLAPSIGGQRSGDRLLGNPTRERLLAIHDAEVCRLAASNISNVGPASASTSPSF
jgi:hypothetical protein